MTTKDIVNRSIFPADQMASIMTNITNITTTRKPDGRRMVTIEFPWTDTNPNLSDDELEMECVKLLQSLSDDTVKHWLCNHKWIKG